MSNGRFDISTTFKAVDKFTAPLKRMMSSTQQFAKVGASIGQQNKVVDKLSSGFMAVGAAAVGMGAIGGAALYAIGKSGAEFEQAITDVGAVMGKPRAQIQDLEKAAMSLGVTTQFSAGQVAEGMQMMARKGFNAKEILQGIPGVLDAVAASGEDMATVTTIVGSTIRGFGLDASQASRIADVLSYVSVKTGASITDLGSALGSAAPTAHALGMSIEDTTVGLGLMQKVGIDASVSASALATMLAKISHPSKEAAEKMKAMGISFKTAKGNMLTFPQVLGQFVKAGDKAGGNMDKMAFFADLVGLRGDKAALALSDMAKSGQFDELLGGLKNVAGFSHTIAEERLNTTKGSWKVFTSTIDVLSDKLWGLQSGPLKDVIDSVNKWAAANQDLIVSKVGDFVKGISDNLPKIITWAERAGKFAAVWMAWGAAVKVASAAIKAFAFVAAANPMTLIAIAAVAAIAAVVAFWPEISSFFGRVWTGIKDVASKVGSAVGGIVQSVWSPVKSFLQGALEFVVGLFTEAITPLLPILQPVFDAVGAAASYVMSLWAPVSTFFEGLWSGIATAFSSAWDSISGFAATEFAALKAIWAPIGEFFSGLWTSIAGTFMSIVGGVIDKIESAVGFVRGVGRHTLGTDTDGASSDGGSQMVNTTAAGISQSLIENNVTTSTGVVEIRDTTGRASVARKPSGFSMPLVPASGTL